MVPPLSALEDKGIEIETDPESIGRLPPYVEDLRQLLLNFREIVPLNRKPNLELLYKRDKHLLNREFPLEDHIYCDSGHATYQTRWDAAFNLRDKAKDLPDRQKEYFWTGLMSNFVFNDINYHASDRGILLRDLLSWGSDELFTNAKIIRGRFSDHQEHPPKPDFWFGLGLYNRKQRRRLKGLELKDKSIQYFRQDNLKAIGMIRDKSLIYQPGPSSKPAGFPWMVAELKKEFGNENECLMQAVNASYTSLKLCEGLATPVKKKVLPVVAFTSIGPNVKIFIAYKFKKDSEDEKIYHFSCIWSGNIENIWHAVQLRRIVDQLKVWALTIFKPWVTGCLERWYEKTTCDETEDESESERESEEEDEEEDETED